VESAPVLELDHERWCHCVCITLRMKWFNGVVKLMTTIAGFSSRLPLAWVNFSEQSSILPNGGDFVLHHFIWPCIDVEQALIFHLKCSEASMVRFMAFTLKTAERFHWLSHKAIRSRITNANAPENENENRNYQEGRTTTMVVWVLSTVLSNLLFFF